MNRDSQNAIGARASVGSCILHLADMDTHHTIVTAGPATKSNAETPKKARWEARSENHAW
jgi:hypothetical protein